MKKIFKYVLTDDSCLFPINAKPLCVQLQNGRPTVWAEVDPEDPDKRNKRFFIIGTGHEIPFLNLEYVGTFQQEPFVWHVYVEAE